MGRSVLRTAAAAAAVLAVAAGLVALALREPGASGGGDGAAGSAAGRGTAAAPVDPFPPPPAAAQRGEPPVPSAPSRPGRAARPVAAPEVVPVAAPPTRGERRVREPVLEPGRLVAQVWTRDGGRGAVAGLRVRIDGIEHRTAAEGVLDVAGLAPGDHTVELLGDGYAPQTLRWTTAATGAAGQPLAWWVERVVPFRVEVRCEDDQPVVGATVALIPDSTSGSFARFVAVTDAAGVAELRDAPGGKANVWVHPGTADGRPTSRAIASRAAGDAGPLRVKVYHGRAVRSRVEGPDGLPVAGAQIVVTEQGAIPRRIFPDATTDADGRFAVTMSPGEPWSPLYIVAPAVDGPDWRFAARVVRFLPREEETIRLAAGFTVEGRAVDPSGAAHAHRDIELIPKTAGALTPPTVTRTDDQGRFRIRGVAAGVYLLVIPASRQSSPLLRVGGGAASPGQVPLPQSEPPTLVLE